MIPKKFNSLEDDTRNKIVGRFCKENVDNYALHGKRESNHVKCSHKSCRLLKKLFKAFENFLHF